MESVIQDFYCLHRLDTTEWTAYYSRRTICHEYRYGYIYMYFFFVIGDWLILYSPINISYLLVIHFFLSQLLFFRYLICLHSTLRRCNCTFRQSCLLYAILLAELCLPSNHQSVRLFYSLIPPYLTPFAADSQKDPLMMISYD